MRAEPLDERLLALLRRVVLVAVPLALLGLLPGAAGDAFGWAAVGVVVAAPLARVLWLAAAWTARHDVRFALTAALLLLVVASGAVIAAVRG